MNSITKKVSGSSTGIVLKRTKMTDSRQGVIEKIVILPELDCFEVYYRVERFDSLGNPFTDVEYKTKKVKFKDVGEKGVVSNNSEGFPDMTTYEKTDDEVLNVTNWYATLGTSIMGSAISFVETKEGL